MRRRIRKGRLVVTCKACQRLRRFTLRQPPHPPTPSRTRLTDILERERVEKEQREAEAAARKAKEEEEAAAAAEAAASAAVGGDDEADDESLVDIVSQPTE
jgi:hypothetical protein